MTLLDELSGFEFEDVMVDVFRHKGYENVEKAAEIADEGRDITMIDPDGSEPVGVVVECKHTDVVSRPVVQKLHSAVKTHTYDGPVSGMVVTTGRFTGPAEEYADRVTANPEDISIELLDGRDLREIGEEIGMDLYSGRIEILCEETIRPPLDRDAIEDRVRVAADPIDNLESARVRPKTATIRCHPVLVVRTDIKSVFETSVGVIHRIDEQDVVAISADRNGPRILDRSVTNLIVDNLDSRTELDDSRLEAVFDTIEIGRFGLTETEYKDWIIDQQQERYTTTVTYTGDNNVTYNRTCTPKRSDVRIEAIEPVYIGYVGTKTALVDHEYGFEYFAAQTAAVVGRSDFLYCVQCGAEKQLTFCQNCGSIDCSTHIKTERLVDEPVCTGCAVTGQFFFATKYFSSEANLEAFRAEYESMPFYRKPFENPILIAIVAVVLFGLVLLLLTGL